MDFRVVYSSWRWVIFHLVDTVSESIVLCVNLCEKIFPKSAKMKKISEFW